jgi:mannose/fructose/N-acetylgalactosamine-specific phosphotransferase system component IIC
VNELPLFALMVWATLTGLDLASVLQGLLNRPLVAGGIAGVIIGDPASGLAIGGALELFALDVLPVGSVRYPDYGAATVAAVAYGAWQPWAQALGPSVLIGLLLGYLGGWSVVLHRRVNAVVLRRYRERLDRGDEGIATRLHVSGIGSDLLRIALLPVVGLGAVTLLLQLPRLDVPTSQALTTVAVAGGVLATVGGALRRAGTPQRILWFSGGLAAGLLSLVLR